MGVIKLVKERIEISKIESELLSMLLNLEIKGASCSSCELHEEVDRLDALVERAELFNQKMPYTVNFIPINHIHKYLIEELETNLHYGKYAHTLSV
jgi:hypothetical protein